MPSNSMGMLIVSRVWMHSISPRSSEKLPSSNFSGKATLPLTLSPPPPIVTLTAVPGLAWTVLDRSHTSLFMSPFLTCLKFVRMLIFPGVITGMLTIPFLSAIPWPTNRIPRNCRSDVVSFVIIKLNPPSGFPSDIKVMDRRAHS